MNHSDCGRSDDLTATLIMDDFDALIEHLNDDLARELQAIIMYLRCSALLRGLLRSELADVVQTAISDEQRHARYLADKIATLGGIPTTLPKPVPAAATAYQMLRNLLNVEGQTIGEYTNRILEAGFHGELDLKFELERIVGDETRHLKHIEQILAGWNQANAEIPVL